MVDAQLNNRILRLLNQAHFVVRIRDPDDRRLRLHHVPQSSGSGGTVSTRAASTWLDVQMPGVERRPRPIGARR
jgi:hypothetical protein